MSWPLAQPPGWSSGSVTLRGSPGLREQVGGVLGMLWRIRILRDVLFFVNCSESGVCACVYTCVVWMFGCYSCLFVAMLSLFGGLTIKASNFQELDKPPNLIPLQYVCEALIFLPCDQVNVMLKSILGG